MITIHIKGFARHTIAIFFWLFIVITVFDLDTYLIAKYIPAFEGISYYKLFFFIGAISVIWLIVGKKEFPKLVLFIIAYPFIMLFLMVLKFIWNHWSLAIVFTPAVYEVASNFQLFFISYAVALIVAGLIITTHNTIMLSFSMAILAGILFLHLISSFRQVYKATVFTKLANGISSVKTKLTSSNFLDDILTKSQTKNNDPSKAESSFNDSLSTLYCFHWGVEFIKDKIRVVMQSRKMDLYLILSWFWTVILTALVFSLEYWALYKIDPHAFSAPYMPNYFSFLGFSFGKLTPSSVSAIEPTTAFAVLLCYAELICSLLILVILAFTILTAARERYREDIENIVSALGDIAILLQESSQRLFDLALADAEILLVEHNQSLINGLRKLRGLPEIQPKVEGEEDNPNVEHITRG